MSGSLFAYFTGKARTFIKWLTKKKVCSFRNSRMLGFSYLAKTTPLKMIAHFSTGARLVGGRLVERSVNPMRNGAGWSPELRMYIICHHHISFSNLKLKINEKKQGLVLLMVTTHQYTPIPTPNMVGPTWSDPSVKDVMATLLWGSSEDP